MAWSHVGRLPTLMLAAGLVACGAGSTGPSGNNGNNSNTGGAAATVTLQNKTFSPQFDTVSAGTVVTWKNADAIDHTSTADDGSWDSGSIAAGASFTRTFSQAGSYPYHCSFHGAPGQGMYGVLVVK